MRSLKYFTPPSMLSAGSNDVLDAIIFDRLGHELHQAQGAFFRDRETVVIGFGGDDRMDEPGIDGVSRRDRADQGVVRGLSAGCPAPSPGGEGRKRADGDPASSEAWQASWECMAFASFDDAQNDADSQSPLRVIYQVIFRGPSRGLALKRLVQGFGLRSSGLGEIGPPSPSPADQQAPGF